MKDLIYWAFLIIILILIIYFGRPASGEKFNNTYHESSLEKDMDYIKDNKGYTLNDYILDDHSTFGKGIDSPF